MIDRKIVKAVAARPRLWGEALRASAALARKGWWHRPPFVPIPEPRYMSWRVATAYGSSHASVTPSDVVAYLEWRKRQRSGG